MKTVDALATAAVMLASFGFMAVRLKMLGKYRRDRRPVGLWLFGLCLGTGLFFRSSFIYGRFNALTGVKNLAWLFSCLFLILSVYVLAESCAGVHQDQNFYKIRQAAIGGLLLTLFIILFFFWRDIVTAPEYYYPGDIVPADVASMTIKATMLFYVLLIAWIPARVYHRLFVEETVLAAKIRWFLTMTLVISAALLFLSRLILVISGYFFDLPDGMMNWFGVVVNTTQILLALWPLAFLVVRFYDPLANLITHIRKLLILRNLLALQRACRNRAGLSSPALLDLVTLQDRLSHPDLYVHKALIAILDYKSCLKSAPITDGNTCGWLEELFNICDETDYHSQVQAYSQLGAKLRKQRHKER